MIKAGRNIEFHGTWRDAIEKYYAYIHWTKYSYKGIYFVREVLLCKRSKERGPFFLEREPEHAHCLKLGAEAGACS